MRVAAVLALSSAVCLADPVTEAADRALAAFRAGTGLQEIAALDEPDPWLVADELCARGAFDAAEAFAKAAVRPDTERLAGYVVAQRVAPTFAAQRRLLADLLDASAKEDWRRMSEIARSAGPADASVVSLRLQHGLGLGLLHGGEPRAAIPALLATALGAERLGRLRVAGLIYKDASIAAERAVDHEASIDALARRVAVQHLRRAPKDEFDALVDLSRRQRSFGRPADAATTADRALALAESAALGSSSRAAAHNEVGAVAQMRGASQEAKRHLVAALELAPGGAVAANAHMNLGLALFDERALDEARRSFESALDSIARAERDGDLPPAPAREWSTASALNLGLVMLELGEQEAGMRTLERALELANESRNASLSATVLHSLGNAHAEASRYPDALRCYEAGLLLAREAGLPRAVVDILVALGDARRRMLDFDGATRAFDEADRLAASGGDAEGRAVAVVGRARVELARRDPAAALRLLDDPAVREGSAPRTRAVAAMARADALVELAREGDSAVPREEAFAHWRQLRRPAECATTALDLAVLHAGAGRDEEARRWLDEGVRFLAETRSPAARADAHEKLAMYFNRRDDPARAEAHAREALAQETDRGGHFEATRLELARACRAQGRLREAHEAATAALGTDLCVRHPSLAAQVLSELAFCCFMLGRTDEAIDREEEALRLARTAARQDAVASSLGNLGIYLKERGDFARVLECEEEALRIIRKSGRKRAEAGQLINHAGTFRSLGDLGKAKELLLAALDICEGLSVKGETARALLVLGGIASAEGDTALARSCRERARQHYEEIGNPSKVAECVRGLGWVCWRDGDRREAVEMLKEAARLHEAGAGPDPRSVLSVAMALSDAGETLDAEAWYERALALPRDDSPVALAAGYFCSARGDHARAEALFEEAATHLETLLDRARGISDEQSIGMMRALHFNDAFLGLAMARMDLEDQPGALGAMERGRARLVLNLLARSRIDALAEAERRAREQGDEARLARITAVRSDLAACEEEIARLGFLARAAREPARRDEVQRLAEAERRRSEVAAARNRLVAELLPVGHPLGPVELQQLLGPSELLLFYLYGPDAGIVTLVPPGGRAIRSFKLSDAAGNRVPATDLERLVEGHAARLRQGGRGVAGPPAPESRSDAGTSLMELLVPREAREELSRASRVYIVPHGALHRLSFESLPWGGRTWLDAGPQIAYVHSASVLAWCRQRRDAQRGRPTSFDVVAVGDPRFGPPEAGEAALPAQGVLITSPAGPLLAGDVLLAYDGRSVADATALRDALRSVSDAIEEGRRDSASVTVLLWPSRQRSFGDL